MKREILLIVLLFVVCTTMAAINAPKQELVTGADIGIGMADHYEVAMATKGKAEPANSNTYTDVGAGEVDTTISNQLGSELNQEALYPEAKEETGSPHISDSTDNTVTYYLIPLLVFIGGIFWKTWDKDRLTKILLKLWSLIKDCDNFFSNPDAITKTDIERYGVNAAKKRWVEREARKTLTATEQAVAIKKTGSIGNAIEFAINTFKIGVPIFNGVAGLIKKL